VLRARRSQVAWVLFSIATVLVAGCQGPPPRSSALPPSAEAALPPPGDYAVHGLKEPLARVGAPIEKRPGSRGWSFTGPRGTWHLELGRYDEKGRVTELLSIDGRSANAQRADLDWSLLVAAEGKPKERFTGKLLLRAHDRRRMDGVLTFDEIPGRRDELVLERLEDPLAGE
jgi:hypothetical protein